MFRLTKYYSLKLLFPFFLFYKHPGDINVRRPMTEQEGAAGR